jgi:cysteine-rich repeat protein
MHRGSGKNSLAIYTPSIVIVAGLLLALGGSCLFDTKTNLCESFGRRCAPGQVCAVNQAVCINIGGCGDGVVGPGEVCDDGNLENGDMCSSDCKTDELCGNKIIDFNEDCDAGVGDSPGCNSNCKFARCGDGYANSAAGEECDSDGMDTSTCNGKTCRFAKCGDQYYNPRLTLPGTDLEEQCDTGGMDTPACDSDCTAPICGDGHFNPMYAIPGVDRSEQCDGGVMDTMNCDNDCTLVDCGDGHLNAVAGEVCDDGNRINIDGCPDGAGGTCKPARCGDGFIRAGVETCDDGNGNNLDACPDGAGGTCQPARCGDGFVRAGVEMCDDGNGSNADGCPDGTGGTCKPARCGDGFVQAGVEECEKNGDCSGSEICSLCICSAGLELR